MEPAFQNAENQSCHNRTDQDAEEIQQRMIRRKEENEYSAMRRLQCDMEN
ncbi:hypothetical protein PO124_06400 [Bacillus licheniformis]|nr:hypothetical protein [Bacillus licheniformis]